MQLPTPPPVKGQSMRLMTPPTMFEKKEHHPDMFLDMLQGPVIVIIVGSSSLERRYTLPINLLCAHSVSLRNDITRLANSSLNKKRKYTPEVAEGDVEPKAEPKPTSEFVIRLADVNPSIFGLLLKYMYTGSYPQTVDGRPLPITRASNRFHQSPYPNTATVPSTLSTTHTPHAIYANHISVNAPEAIPPSIHAWLLAHRLGAIGFMNHAMTRIYHGIGTYFAITPSLVDYVWRQTMPTSSDLNAPTFDSTTPRTCPILSAHPLCKFFVDALVTHWASPHANIIDKGAGVQHAWDELFNAHSVLRREFIFGLQGGVRVLTVQEYYTASAVGGSGASSQGASNKSLVKKEECFQGKVGKEESGGANEMNEATASNGEPKGSKTEGTGETELKLDA